MTEIPRSRFGLVALRAGRRRLRARPALTLLEVLIALAIFLLAMVVFGEIIVRNGEIARDLQRQNLATRLCQSKLEEVAAGVVPLDSQSDASFDEEPDYTWSVDAQNGAVDGLWNVTVRVTRRQTDAGSKIEAALSQMILDPSIEGSTQDVTPVTSSTSSSTNNGSSTPSTGAPATGSTTPATSTPAVAAPAASAPAPATAPTPAPKPTTSAPKPSMGK